MPIKYQVLVIGDTNDGDYVTQETILTDEAYDQLLPLLYKVAGILRQPIKHQTKHGPQLHNWPNGETLRDDLGELAPNDLYKDLLTEEEYETFDELVPYGEYGIHTITHIVCNHIAEQEFIY